MCGRIVDYLTDQEIADRYLVKGGARPGIKRPPNYNLKPTQDLRAVRLDEDGRRELAHMRWGFVPAWSKEMPKQAWINATAISRMFKHLGGPVQVLTNHSQVA